MYARTLLVGLMVCGMAANAGAQPRDASGNEWASGSNLAAGPDVVRPSYHQALLEAHRDTPVNRDLIDGPVQVPQVRGATSNPCSIVFGYLPYWESSANIQWNRLTHLGAFSIQINSAGNVTNAHGWPWTSLVNTAHANGVKVHLVVTLFDGAAIQTLINSPANKANFFENMRDLMIAGNADGINIDFESGSGWQGQMDEFMGELSAYMDAEIPGQRDEHRHGSGQLGQRLAIRQPGAKHRHHLHHGLRVQWAAGAPGLALVRPSYWGLDQHYRHGGGRVFRCTRHSPGEDCT
jgi:hypothetical protein